MPVNARPHALIISALGLFIENNSSMGTNFSLSLPLFPDTLRTLNKSGTEYEQYKRY